MPLAAIFQEVIDLKGKVKMSAEPDGENLLLVLLPSSAYPQRL